MKYTLYDSLDYQWEALQLLEDIVNDSPPAKKLARRVESHPQARAELEALFAPCMEIYDTVAARVDTAREDVRYLFSLMLPWEYSVGRVFWYMTETGSDVPGVLRAFAMLLEAEDDTAQDFADEQALVDFVMGYGLGYEHTAKVLFVYHNRELFSGVYQSAIREVEQILRGECVDSVEALLRQYRETVMPEIEALGPDGALEKYGLPLTLDSTALQYDIHPSITLNNGIFLFTADWKRRCSVFWGASILSLMRLTQGNSLSPDRAAEMLRVMADKTKFEILQILSRETLYGSEIAERVRLSPATISHHLSQLSSYQLIHIIKEGTRVYYRTDTRKVAEALDAVGGLLDARRDQA